jgi:hypothetical protein
MERYWPRGHGHGGASMRTAWWWHPQCRSPRVRWRPRVGRGGAGQCGRARDTIWPMLMRWWVLMAAEKHAAVMASQCVRLGVERARERSRGTSEVEAALWRSRGPLGPNRWGHGQCTAATACPCAGTGLRPVGHRCAECLKRSRHHTTDRGTLVLIIS